ncbi:Uncharacterized conserved protein, Ntn-hydrolase superfamily [Chitinophaga terrae (ex Kim and Jung 2007)]|uniref:Uncharacterized conserved protein, Ntn-hydrolase superfamily n=1 Tax=Chitinophaga terrae (ex Kim and Jung 2007) TaxID=408074 RepID=A0A1H3YLP5_9BACT|nr:DUF1028 domain-containing protein [Chitinophaga terrae (ex Kim and Jung 2007)]GEP88375.1 hypothetical protein CTE07_00200 [Chitinophaga terrae (ex Kim and Jung 2007)]SEA12121.1 Uncharacterized conserved protein, Ntn-hydrolase superfamily [Chitinophaga terrae (ex Kim and Jung 2007)]
MRILFIPLFLFFSLHTTAQNLPSLVSGKNINTTFSIVAFDSVAKEWGVAVATNNIYVGNSTIYIQPGLGAFSVIAETEPKYAIEGFEQLKQGKTIQQAIEYTMQEDAERYLRQVSGIDRNGFTFAFTGAAWKYQPGFAGTLKGKNCVAMGNQLGDKVLQAIVSAFEQTNGTLGQRLLAALTAGQRAGGQIQGKQSAALMVKGANNEWYNNIDLRVDNSTDPFEELTRLLNFHYGRIMLNQAINAINMGNVALGKSRLAEAERMVKGWNGIQSKVALAYLLLKEPSKAVDVIRAALAANPKWKENLPAFYLLKDEPRMKSLIDEKHFTEKDWISAVSLMGQLNRGPETISLCNRGLQDFPRSSYLHYLLGKSLLAAGKRDEARKEVEHAVDLDASNEEAVIMLQGVFK